MEILNRYLVTRFHDGVFGVAIQRRIDLREELIRLFIGLRVRSMIDELTDGNPAGQFGHAAEVIEVPVSGDQVVDLREAGIIYSFHDASGVASRRAKISGIDKNRLPRWRN